jgi:hypothetical protein
MATTYTWAVAQMDCYPEEDGEMDVVFNVHWTLAGTEAGFIGYVYGTQGVSLDPAATFTPYADLTEAQVIGWVQAAMGAEQVAAYEANVAEQINNQIVPPVVTPPLPWATPAP